MVQPVASRLTDTVRPDASVLLLAVAEDDPLPVLDTETELLALPPSRFSDRALALAPPVTVDFTVRPSAMWWTCLQLSGSAAMAATSRRVIIRKGGGLARPPSSQRRVGAGVGAGAGVAPAFESPNTSAVEPSRVVEP